MAGKPWYNNGIKEIQVDITKGEQIPKGYVRGRKPLTTEQIENRSAKIQHTIQNKSPSQKELTRKKRSESLKSTYASKSDEEKQLIIQKRSYTMLMKSDEEKAVYREKLSSSLKGNNKGKIPWNKGLTKETDTRVLQNALHTSNTNLTRCKELKQSDPDYFSKWHQYVCQKMKENGTYLKSQPEEILYSELITLYGKDNVCRQYKDTRYPFNCDFYIIEKDLFIELNAHWTHGGQPYDPDNPECQKQLLEWQEKAKTSKYYQNAIYVWTDLDVRKRKIAEENNLNYKTMY